MKNESAMALVNKKSFTETQGKKPFNWYVELSHDCKNITVRRAGYLCKLAREWVTCATGNQCYLIPRNKDDEYAPFDTKLKQLGNEFYQAGIYKMYIHLKNKNIHDANRCRKEAIKKLNEIEELSVKIISELIRQSKYVVKEIEYELRKAKAK